MFNLERFNRTLKAKMWKYFTYNGTKKWINVLQDLVDSYNNSVHSQTQFKPKDVNEENNKTVFKNLYGFDSMRDFLKSQVRKIEHIKGDLVRIPYKIGPLEKSYYPQWQDQILTVDKINNANIKKIIKVKDQLGNKVKRSFYPEELQIVKENIYRIEKIIRKRKVGNKLEYWVKWLGYPDQYNTWEPQENIKLKL